MEITLANDRMKVVVRPDLGGRIDQITDGETGKDWLWHPAGYTGERRVLDIGEAFDDNWSGGWDDIFPSDAAGEFQGRSLPDHGELWSQEWTVRRCLSREIEMVYHCRTAPVTVEKRVSVNGAKNRFGIRYWFRNLSAEPLPFLFKFHPALAIEPGDEILLPPCLIEPVELGFSTLIGRPGWTSFPKAFSASGEEIVINRVPGPEANAQEFFYAGNLEGGWCGVRNGRTGSTLRLHFPMDKLPYVWVFQSYGRFYGHFVLMLEPCTNIPYDLEKALQNGTCAILEPHESREIALEVELTGRA